MHNAASYGHAEIAALLLQHGADINAQDRWGFTALHEAAYKNRTAICALLLTHGADPNIKDHENRTCLDIAQGHDVTSLLRAAAMPKRKVMGNAFSNAVSAYNAPGASNVAATVTCSSGSPSKLTNYSRDNSNVKTKTKNSVQRLISQAVGSASRVVNIVSQDCGAGGTFENRGVLFPSNSKDWFSDSLAGSDDIENPFEPFNPFCLTLKDFLKVTNCENLTSIFEREEISMDILIDMTQDDLKSIGITAFGHRHRVTKGLKKLAEFKQDFGSTIIAAMSADELCSVLEDVNPVDPDFVIVSNAMHSTIREHKDASGGIFKSYNIMNIEKIHSKKLWRRYIHRRREIRDEIAADGSHGQSKGQQSLPGLDRDCDVDVNERLLFHGSPFLNAIVHKGFDERHAFIGEFIPLRTMQVR